MRLFPTRDLFAEVLGGTTKWSRTLEALDVAPSLAEGVAYSIGDSLTYRRGTAEALATDDLVGRRRYHLVVAALDGDVDVEVAPKSSVRPDAPYSDLTDRETFAGTGPVTTVPSGGILIVDVDEAARIIPTPTSSAVALHVTVEGATFHNK